MTINSRRMLSAIGLWLIILTFISQGQCEVIGVYEAKHLAGERMRLEKATRGMWQMMFQKLLKPNERAMLKQARLQFPSLSPDGSLLNFSADAGTQIVTMPIHSLLLLEDACTAYAWLHIHGFTAETINEYAAILKYRRPDAFPGGVYPPLLKTLGIPDNALEDKEVDELSLRFRNSAYAFVLGHEMGHILYQHPGNTRVPVEKSRANERQADKFAVQVIQRDNQIPMGAILFFQMTAFIASPGRFDFPNVQAWQKALRETTHPVTSDRVRALSKRLGNVIGINAAVARDIGTKLLVIAKEMDDRDRQRYYRNVGRNAALTMLRPRP